MKKYCAFMEGRICDATCVGLGVFQGQLTCARMKSAVTFEDIDVNAITIKEAYHGYQITGARRP